MRLPLAPSCSRALEVYATSSTLNLLCGGVILSCDISRGSWYGNDCEIPCLKEEEKEAHQHFASAGLHCANALQPQIPRGFPSANSLKVGVVCFQQWTNSGVGSVEADLVLHRDPKGPG